MNESKYVMAIIKIPVEIFSNGHTVTYDNKVVMDFQEIDRLPDDNQNKSLNIFDKLFSNIKPTYNLNAISVSSLPVETYTDDDVCQNESQLCNKSSEENTELQEENESDEENTELQEENENPITDIIHQIFVKKEEIKKKNRKFNTTFKNKKSKTQRITQKVYSTLNSDNDQDVDLVQSPMDQELQQEDDQ